MKKYLSILLVTLLSTIILFGCKKSNTPAASDYSAAVKDKTWWGVFAYTGKSPEYYSLQLNADNTFMWSESAGDYPGKWVLKDRTLTITFNASGSQIKADISTDDKKLINISVNNNLYVVNSCDLIAHPNIALENTNWVGFTSSAGVIFITKFKPGFLVDVNLNFTTKTYSYSRSSSGAAFRVIGAPYFGVLTSDTTMKGTLISSPASTIAWSTTKGK
jgi:outer membrane protein W